MCLIIVIVLLEMNLILETKYPESLNIKKKSIIIEDKETVNTVQYLFLVHRQQ